VQHNLLCVDFRGKTSYPYSLAGSPCQERFCERRGRSKPPDTSASSSQEKSFSAGIKRRLTIYAGKKRCGRGSRRWGTAGRRSFPISLVRGGGRVWREKGVLIKKGAYATQRGAGKKRRRSAAATGTNKAESEVRSSA